MSLLELEKEEQTTLNMEDEKAKGFILQACSIRRIELLMAQIKVMGAADIQNMRTRLSFSDLDGKIKSELYEATDARLKELENYANPILEDSEIRTYDTDFAPA